MSDFGQIVDLTPAAERGAVVQVVNEHTARLRSLYDQGVSASERLEAIERAVAGTKAALEQERAAERFEWRAEGGARELDALYLRTDGSVSLRGGSTTGEFCGIPVEHKMPGLLTTERGVTPEHERLLQAYRRYALASTLRSRKWEGADTHLRRYAGEFQRALQAMPGRVGDWLRGIIADPAAMTRAINGASGSGAEMISNPTIAAVRRPLLLERRVVGLIPSQRVTTSTFKQSAITGHGLARKRGATADDPARFQRAQFSTTDFSLTVQNMVVNALLDPMWLRDAAGTIDDPMGLVLQWLEQALVDTKEVAFLHGDTAATHQDTISTWTLGSYFNSGDLDGSDSPIKLFIGARARAFDDSNTSSGSGAFTAAIHAAALATMGAHANGAVMILGLNAYYAGLIGNSSFSTVDKLGPRATLLTGQVGVVGDTPVVISEFMPKEFDTSSGLRTGSNAGNEILYTRPGSWSFYDMDNPDEMYDVSYPERGARYIGMGFSTTLAPVVVSGEKPAHVVYYTP